MTRIRQWRCSKNYLLCGCLSWSLKWHWSTNCTAQNLEKVTIQIWWKNLTQKRKSSNAISVVPYHFPVWSTCGFAFRHSTQMWFRVKYTWHSVLKMLKTKEDATRKLYRNWAITFKNRIKIKTLCLCPLKYAAYLKMVSLCCVWYWNI